MDNPDTLATLDIPNRGRR